MLARFERGMETETASSVLVTVQGPEQRVELQLPCDRPVTELLPLLVDVCAANHKSEDARWELAALGSLAFDGTRTLHEVGVMDGALLHLRDAALVFEPWDGLLPQDRTRLVLPPRVSFLDRLIAATGVVLRPQPWAQPVPAQQPQPGQIVTPSSLTVRTAPGLTDRARLSWRSTDYLYRLDAGVVAPQLHRCATIAVMSPKGGVGKTTTTTLLGSLFALLRRDRIVAIDTNPDFGSLGRQLAPEHTIFVDDLFEVLEAPELTATALDNHLGRAAHGLMVLPAPTDPVRVGRLDANAYTQVVRRLQQMVGVIVLDTGTGLHEPAARAAMATADQVVLVSDLEPATASLVAEAAALLAQDGLPTWVVMNKSGIPTDLDLRAFGAAVPNARGMITIRNDVHAARQVAAGRFNWLDAPPSWKVGLRELAVALVAEWPALGIAN
jgi:MinD-like ATPase involved in chromosome partitioning or flagellar assembly